MADTKAAEMSTRIIKVVSSDGEKFDVPRNVIRLSTTINTLLQDLGLDDDDQEGSAIPLQNVTGGILKKVIEWCEHHQNDKPDGEDQTKSDWDNDFLKCDYGTLFELVLAANYLDVKGLLKMCCKGVAGSIKGKTPEEIRTAFNIKNDFTPEEEDQVRKENAWCED